MENDSPPPPAEGLVERVAELRASYAELDIKPGEEWYAAIGKNGFDLCLEGACYRAGQENSGGTDILGRFACGGYAIRALPVIAQAMNTLPALLDALAAAPCDAGEVERLREALEQIAAETDTIADFEGIRFRDFAKDILRGETRRLWDADALNRSRP